MDRTMRNTEQYFTVVKDGRYVELFGREVKYTAHIEEAIIFERLDLAVQQAKRVDGKVYRVCHTIECDAQPMLT